MRARYLTLTAALLCLAACNGSGAEAPGPAGEDEAEALSKAAEMLEDPRTIRNADPEEPESEGETREGL